MAPRARNNNNFPITSPARRCVSRIVLYHVPVILNVYETIALPEKPRTYCVLFARDVREKKMKKKNIYIYIMRVVRAFVRSRFRNAFNPIPRARTHGTRAGVWTCGRGDAAMWGCGDVGCGGVCECASVRRLRFR